MSAAADQALAMAEIVNMIIAHLRPDYSGRADSMKAVTTLKSCRLVNRYFEDAATRTLWRRIDFYSTRIPILILDFRYPSLGIAADRAALVRFAGFVREITLGPCLRKWNCSAYECQGKPMVNVLHRDHFPHLRSLVLYGAGHEECAVVQDAMFDKFVPTSLQRLEFNEHRLSQTVLTRIMDLKALKVIHFRAFSDQILYHGNDLQQMINALPRLEEILLPRNFGSQKHERISVALALASHTSLKTLLNCPWEGEIIEAIRTRVVDPFPLLNHLHVVGHSLPRLLGGGPIFAKLRSIYLSYFWKEIGPVYNAIQAVMEACPKLEALRIDWSLIRDTQQSWQDIAQILLGLRRFVLDGAHPSRRIRPYKLIDAIEDALFKEPLGTRVGWSYTIKWINLEAVCNEADCNIPAPVTFREDDVEGKGEILKYQHPHQGMQATWDGKAFVKVWHFGNLDF